MRITEIRLVVATNPKGGWGDNEDLGTVNEYDLSAKIAHVLEEYEAMDGCPLFHVLYHEGFDVDPAMLISKTD